MVENLIREGTTVLGLPRGDVYWTVKRDLVPKQFEVYTRNSAKAQQPANAPEFTSKISQNFQLVSQQ